MNYGAKLIVRSDDGGILGIDGSNGYNLPSICLVGAEDSCEVCKKLFHDISGVKDGNLIPAYRGPDDEFGTATSYVVNWNGLPKSKKKSPVINWVDPRDILLGKWGLFAIEVFNRLKIMNRPRLDLKKVYRISQKALANESAETGEAIDMILDEVALLVDIAKPWAIDSLLRNVDVGKLHADIISALQTAVEDIPGLPSKDDFIHAANAQTAQIDSLRTKIRFGNHSDVRAAALKIYRKKGVEFGKDLRAGKLSEKFPNMKTIAEAEARIREDGFTTDPNLPGSKEIPLDDWPEYHREAALNRGPRTDVTNISKDGKWRDPRGVYLESPRQREVVPPLPYDPTKPKTPFQEALDRAFNDASDDRSTIKIDGLNENSESDGPHEGPRWMKDDED